MNNSIEIKGLSKNFKQTQALSNLNFSINENTICGLLGRNGAGKSTLLNLISNRLFPSEGGVFIGGKSVQENDRLLGKILYVGEELLIPEETKVRDYFKMTAVFYQGFNMDYAVKLAGEYGLNMKKKVKGLSTGYKTIVKLICALSSDARYLLLDEPVLGLDANHREQFYRDLLENYSESPRTIIISTHLIEEVSSLIEQVVIIKEGALLLNKPADEVRKMGYSVSGNSSEVEAYCSGRDVLSRDSLGGLQTACILGKPENVPQSLQVTALDMQKLFVHLTGA